jgi:membrane protease subunit HflK
MPWSNQGGGGGPWGSGGGPWDKRPGGSGGSGGPTPPNLEDLLRRGQDSMKRVMPGGVGGGKGLTLAALVAVGLWLLTGFYTVDAGEQGVPLLFGKWTGTTTPPGLRYWLPGPIGDVVTPNTERVNRVDIGFRGGPDGDTRGAARRSDVPEESLMLTSDQNVADLDFTVLWKIRDAGEFLFKIRDPEQTVRIVAESAMREVAGRTRLQTLLTTGRVSVEQDTRLLLQEVLDDYEAGIFVQAIQLLEVEPPSAVIDAFNDVQRARQDRTRTQNEADAYANRIVPTARGEASRVTEDAHAYKEQIIKEAEGEGQRFTDVYAAYLVAPEVTARRMYLDTMSGILNKANKIIIDANAEGGGVVPYLPLPEVNRQIRGNASPNGAAP